MKADRKERVQARLVYKGCGLVGALGVLTINVPTPTVRTLNTLVNFNGINGTNPYAGLIEGKNGNFYGTTTFGGANDKGTVFKLNPDTQQLTTIANFNSTNGAYPYARLIEGKNGDFYGTTATGGANDKGTVFKLNPDTQQLTTIVNFNSTNGAYPYAGLIEGKNGNFYGTTTVGGANDKGTVFKLNPDTQQLITIANFNSTNGAYPHAGLIEGNNGNFYGTTVAGGANARGTVFKFNPDTQQLTTIVNFNSTNGAYPYPGLTEGKNGDFYGTTTFGGVNDKGTVFKLNPDTQKLTTIAIFNGTNGAYPQDRLIKGSKGDFYGTTGGGGVNDKGTVFKLNPDTQQLTTIANFNGINGAYPQAGLIEGKNGDFYGTAYTGGVNDNGTVFKLKSETQQFILF